MGDNVDSETDLYGRLVVHLLRPLELRQPLLLLEDVSSASLPRLQLLTHLMYKNHSKPEWK